MIIITRFSLKIVFILWLLRNTHPVIRPIEGHHFEFTFDAFTLATFRFEDRQRYCFFHYKKNPLLDCYKLFEFAPCAHFEAPERSPVPIRLKLFNCLAIYNSLIIVLQFY